jgi:transcriptional regulator with GAF, ATPase, and Fis domain
METDPKAGTTGPLPRPRQTTIVADRTQIQLQRCKLVQMTGGAKGREFELSRRRVVVGSSESCDLRLTDNTVSKEHFAIIRDEQSYLLQDLGSTNGTFLDNARIKEVYLRPGALIKAGEVFFRFEPVYERIELVPSDRADFSGLLGVSFRMREIFTVLEKVAATEATILLQGETGTGKGAVARAIHQASLRKDQKIVIFDCGAIAPTLIESELFGHERGAFTGADRPRIGRFEQASGGTLFLDEVGDMSPATQAKLLRVLQDQEFHRLGGTRILRTDARIVAATNRDLAERVRGGSFREDLLFRLDVIRIELPPLRERAEDVVALAHRFLREFSAQSPRPPRGFSEGALRRLQGHTWPGNVRELRNAIERAVLMAEGVRIRAEDLALCGEGLHPAPGASAPSASGSPVALREMERRLVVEAHQRMGWVQKDAARLLGVSRRKLNYMVQRMGITHPSWRRNRPPLIPSGDG